MKRLAILILAFASLAHAQTAGTGIGSNASPLTNNTGRPIADAGVAICQPVATTAAIVSGNLATFTTASNPVTAGFASGATILVSGFTGGDTYFNAGSLIAGQIVSGYTILAVSPTTITVGLTHANASASTSGAILQEGNQFVPCAGLSTVYSDPADTMTTANPFATDALGNWQVYGPAGVYYVQFYGSGIPTIVKIIVTSSGTSSGGGSPGGASGDVQTNNGSGGFGGGTQLSVLSKKPKTSDAIQFVSLNGNDSNDGFSWGTAKLTVMAAYDVINANNNGGVVYFTGGVSATSTAGQGIWLCGPGDSACYASPPTGWRTIGKNVSFVGVGTNPEMVGGGSGPGGIHPAIWVSGYAGSLVFDNFQYHALNNGIIVGCSASFDCTGPGGSSGVTFRHIIGHIAGIPGAGPDALLGSNTFWVFFEDCGLSGNPVEQVGISTVARSANVTTVTTSAPFTVVSGQHLGLQQVSDITFNTSAAVASVIDSTHFTIPNSGTNVTATALGGTVITDKQIPIVVDPGTGFGSGLIFVTSQNGGNFYSMGGVRLWSGGGGGGIYASGFTVEGDFAHVVAPPVWVGFINSPTITRAQNIELADAVGVTPTVEIDNANNHSSGSTVLSGIPGTIVGPATILDGQMTTNTVVSPLRNRQVGFFGGRTEAQSDVARGAGSPVTFRSVNLANTNPASWTSLNGGGVTTGITAPDGTTGAGQFSGGSGANGGSIPISTGPSLAVGNVYVFGLWTRSTTGNGYLNSISATFTTNSGAAGPLNRCNSTTLPTVGVIERYQGDGEWDWVYGVCKLTTIDSGIGLAFLLNPDSSHTVQAYGPVVLGFAPGIISDNEAYELANNLAPFSPSCAVATLCDLTGPIAHVAPVPLAVGSSTGNVVLAPNGFFVCTASCTVTPPIPAAGYQFCVMNDDNVATIITLGALGGSAQYENTARTAYGTAGTGTVTSAGAAADQICIIGRDATHYLTKSFTGTWTAH